MVAVLASLIPSEASACRIGGDWNLFKEAPSRDVLPGAQIIHVQFSNTASAIQKWPKWINSPDPSNPFDYWLIGVARIIDDSSERDDLIPVYAFVTSCSPFHGMTFGEAGDIDDEEFYLIGRLASGSKGLSFLAGGNHNGRWHF